MLNLEVMSADKLPEELVHQWLRIQDSSADLRHPMLSPEFIQCVARHRTDVQVAVIESGSAVTGFFPFQRERRVVGRPAAYRMSDYQAALLSPEAVIDASWLLRRCGLSVWHFDHLITSQRCFAAGHFLFEGSPYIDLSQGIDAYRLITSRSSRWKSTLRKGRNLEREVGPVRLEFHTADRDVFRQLIEWKSLQVKQNRKRCIFDWNWVMGSLEDLRVTEEASCAGTLSALYAGEQLVAAHLGLRSQEVLHWWITAYDPRFKRYSPGALLLIRLIEEAARRGVRRIDLGKGDEPYKTTFQSGVRPLASGALCTSAWNRYVQKASYLLKERIRTSPVALPAKTMAYWLEARVNRTGTAARIP
jgi:CelD/BcsL family acetyltransferase involved in cellulose biosynthesis